MFDTLTDKLRNAAASGDSCKHVSQLLSAAADEIEHWKDALRERLAAKQRAFAAFGHQDEFQLCACAYCRGDAEDLAEMCGEYELQMHSAKEQVKELRAKVDELTRAYTNTDAAIASPAVTGGPRA